MLPSYPLILASQAADGAALANSVAATNVLHGSGIGTIPAGILQVGSTLKMTFSGRLSSIVTTPGNLTLDVLIGAVAAFSTAAIPLNTVAQTNDSIWGEILLTIRALGTGATANAIGLAHLISSGFATQLQMQPAAAPAVGTGFDSSVANLVALRATFSVANAGNSLTIHQCLTELKV